jgi:5-(carboxyamino)imidazole ribonucleotide synthase
MFAMVAQRMGYRVCVFTPESDGPASHVAARTIVSSFDDTEALADFAQQVDAITLEFENIPVSALETLAQSKPVYPQPYVLARTQDRILEKTFLSEGGFPVTPFAPVYSLADLNDGISSLGCPSVLKTAGFGYDGKGQVKIQEPSQAPKAYEHLFGQPGILEQWVSYELEFSVIAARTPRGEIACYPPIENHHQNHILDVSVTPAAIPQASIQAALEITRQVVETLDAVGVICLEFFLTKDHQVLINEIAPRPHNSGHLTIEAMPTSQFEQQVRTMCGLPLGAIEPSRPAAMANLLGDLWEEGAPDWPALLQEPHIQLHLYGKAPAKPGRKMGHLTTLGETAEQARQRVCQARAHILWKRQPAGG